MSSADEILEGFRVIADTLERLAETWDLELAWGVPPTHLVHRAITESRLVAAAARPATGGDQ